MAAIPLVLMLAGTAISAAAQHKQGQEQQNLANYEAAQLDQNAGQAQASSQRAALNEQRNTSLLLSRARAVAAASGGGVSDPAVVNIMARIAGEGTYRADTARYEGDTQARGMKMQADALRYQGAGAAQAGNLTAASTALSGGAQSYSMYKKYGSGITNTIS